MTDVVPQPAPTMIERYRGWILGGVAAIIVVALGTIVVLKFGPTTAGKEIAAGAQPADPALVAALGQIPASTFDAVGAGSVDVGMKPLAAAPPLTDNGKPEVLYVGAEYCPYCAAERWAMVTALSRFGSFGNLHTVRSAAGDAFPNTATFTFFGSTYTSQYLSFVPVEQYTNQPGNSENGYTTLQNLTSDQKAVVDKWNTSGAIPFVDFGGKFEFAGATYSPAVLGGLNWTRISTRLSDPSSSQAQAVLGSANMISAAICQVTGQEPADVCGSPAVQKGLSQMAKPLPK